MSSHSFPTRRSSDLGVSHFLIRGFDPLIDAIDYGRDLIPRTRELIANRTIAKEVAA